MAATQRNTQLSTQLCIVRTGNTTRDTPTANNIMAARISPSAVVRYFSGDDTALPEIFFEGSDDELGMEDQELDDSEPPFEPLEVEDQGEFTVMIHIIIYTCGIIRNIKGRYTL